MQPRNCFTRILAVLLLLGGVALTSGCASDKAVISQANEVHTELAPAVITDPTLSNYIQRVGDRIIAAARQTESESHKEKNSSWMFSKDMKFHFVNSKDLNAFTTGGEHMYVYTALFQQAASEDELAAVMAHEFGHVYARHVQQGMNRQMGIMAAAAGAGAAGYALGGSDKGGEYAGIGAGAAAAIGQFVGMGYTRQDEAEADKLGFEFYTRAGWDPHHFGDFFKRMIDMGYDKGPAYLSDHPSLKSRLDLANQRAKELPASAQRYRKAPVADVAEFDRLKERANELAKTMPDDKSLKQSQLLLAALPRSCITPAVHEDQIQAEKKILAAKQTNNKKKKGQEPSGQTE